MCTLCMLGCCMCDYYYNTIKFVLLAECRECVCVAVEQIVVGGRRLGVGWWLWVVCVLCVCGAGVVGT